MTPDQTFLTALSTFTDGPVAEFVAAYQAKVTEAVTLQTNLTALQTKYDALAALVAQFNTASAAQLNPPQG